MIVISDTSPLNYLILIGHVQVLPELFVRVVVPDGVITELSHPKTPDPVRQWIAALPAWVDVRTPALPDPGTGLGAGENQAISLALELKSDYLLMDDAAGRDAARARGILTMGTIGVLERAAERGLLQLPDALDRLRRTTFRAGRAVYAQALARDAARKASESAGG